MGCWHWFPKIICANLRHLRLTKSSIIKPQMTQMNADLKNGLLALVPKTHLCQSALSAVNQIFHYLTTDDTDERRFEE